MMAWHYATRPSVNSTTTGNDDENSGNGDHNTLFVGVVSCGPLYWQVFQSTRALKMFRIKKILSISPGARLEQEWEGARLKLDWRKRSYNFFHVKYNALMLKEPGLVSADTLVQYIGDNLIERV